MNDIAGIITAIVALLALLGGGFRFLWNKIEARFCYIESELEKCRRREIASSERRSIQVTVIELLWQEVKRHMPDSDVLVRAKKLLDDLKQLGEKTESDA